VPLPFRGLFDYRPFRCLKGWNHSGPYSADSLPLIMPKGFLQRSSQYPSDSEFQRNNPYNTIGTPSVVSGRTGYTWSRRNSAFIGTSPAASVSSFYTYNTYTDMTVNMASPPTSGHSNFARASCAVCGEPLTTSFQGEKVIEPPDCPHVMHEQCYKEFSKDFQNCAICSKPLHIRRNTNANTINNNPYPKYGTDHLA
jgi:hypothetical protein